MESFNVLYRTLVGQARSATWKDPPPLRLPVLILYDHTTQIVHCGVLNLFVPVHLVNLQTVLLKKKGQENSPDLSG